MDDIEGVTEVKHQVVRPCLQLGPVAVTKGEVDLFQQTIDEGELEDLLVGNYKNQLKLVVQLVMEFEGLVDVDSATPLLWCVCGGGGVKGKRIM